MFAHNKRLQDTVRVSETNPGLAKLMLEQFGGPQGHAATEELSHQEVIGTLVAMLNKGAKGRIAEGMASDAELYRAISGGGNDSHVTQVPYGGGPPLTNSAGMPWSAACIGTMGDPSCDLRSNITAEARAKIIYVIYGRRINLTDDPGVKEALGFLMTREISRQLSFEKALYAMDVSFPPGKLPGMKEFSHVYFNTSTGDGDRRGPWNDEPCFDFRDADSALDGGSGRAEVHVTAQEADPVEQAALRTRSDPDADPLTGAELASGNGSDNEPATLLGPHGRAA